MPIRFALIAALLAQTACGTIPAGFPSTAPSTDFEQDCVAETGDVVGSDSVNACIRQRTQFETQTPVGAPQSNMAPEVIMEPVPQQVAPSPVIPLPRTNGCPPGVTGPYRGTLMC